MRLRSLVFSLFLIPALSAAGAPEGMRAAELRNMLLQDCGSCHGLSFKGGLGPALLPGNLRDKPEDYLTATILYGRPGTPMPPWRLPLYRPCGVST